MTDKELEKAKEEREAEKQREQELLKILDEIDSDIERTEADRLDLLEKEKGIIEDIRALDTDYSHFVN